VPATDPRNIWTGYLLAAGCGYHASETVLNIVPQRIVGGKLRRLRSLGPPVGVLL